MLFFPPKCICIQIILLQITFENRLRPRSFNSLRSVLIKKQHFMGQCVHYPFYLNFNTNLNIYITIVRTVILIWEKDNWLVVEACENWGN